MTIPKQKEILLYDLQVLIHDETIKSRYSSRVTKNDSPKRNNKVLLTEYFSNCIVLFGLISYL